MTDTHLAINAHLSSPLDKQLRFRWFVHITKLTTEILFLSIPCKPFPNRLEKRYNFLMGLLFGAGGVALSLSLFLALESEEMKKQQREAFKHFSELAEEEHYVEV